MDTLSRRDFAKLSVVGGLATLPILNTDWLVSSAEAKDGKELVFLSSEAVTGNWDPTSHTNLGQLTVEGFIYGYLTRARMQQPDTDELVYELATSYKLLDPHTLEFKLREGVLFHDGKPFGAEDVKATYEYGSLPDRPAQWYPGRVDVEVVDPLTVRLKTAKYGYPASLYIYLSSFLPISSAKDVANKTTLSARPNGTGPFKFASQDGDKTVMVANDKFFKGVPKLSGVRVNYVGDATTRALSLLSGQADITERLENEQAQDIGKNPAFVLRKSVSVENKYLFFRCSKPPFNDPRVRLAACHAINRSSILEVMGESGVKSSAHISPVKFGYIDVPEYPEFDPAKCQALLAEAGFPRGAGLPELEYLTSDGRYPKTKEYGEVITAMLQAQGFPVKLTVMEPAAWGNLLYDRPGGGAGHMIDCGWATGSPEPDLVLRTHFHSSSKRITGIVDKELDASLDKERSAPSLDERKRVLQQETLPMIARKAPAHSLFTSVFIHAQRKDIEGLFIYPNGVMDASVANI
ncbi:ABC transporter substrate-binding protein [Bradyrhizobium tropiciagri]|uniref:ABC transporter substrate-binding protein n=1 Tax=Bradyrhizobium tropiciagri TaxID=312253 RepID=UPI001BA4C3AE|nr:ABC transporter substrate-binding protein [Bradyrhizobium tropiciagri]MBR0898990.1 ABC transporter substrate-binding protein [Bradyrhizobium tropiciagri]